MRGKEVSRRLAAGARKDEQRRQSTTEQPWSSRTPPIFPTGVRCRRRILNPTELSTGPSPRTSGTRSADHLECEAEVRMFRALFKLIILLIVIAVAAGFYFGWWGSSDGTRERESIEAAGRSAAERAKVVGCAGQRRARRRCADGQDQGEDGARRQGQSSRSQYRHLEPRRHRQGQRPVQPRSAIAPCNSRARPTAF